METLAFSAVVTDDGDLEYFRWCPVSHKSQNRPSDQTSDIIWAYHSSCTIHQSTRKVHGTHTTSLSHTHWQHNFHSYVQIYVSVTPRHLLLECWSLGLYPSGPGHVSAVLMYYTVHYIIKRMSRLLLLCLNSTTEGHQCVKSWREDFPLDQGPSIVIIINTDN